MNVFNGHRLDFGPWKISNYGYLLRLIPRNWSRKPCSVLGPPADVICARKYIFSKRNDGHFSKDSIFVNLVFFPKWLPRPNHSARLMQLEILCRTPVPKSKYLSYESKSNVKAVNLFSRPECPCAPSGKR